MIKQNMTFHTLEYYSTVKRNELLRATSWMSFKSIMQYKGSQMQKTTYFMFPLFKMSRKGKSRDRRQISVCLRLEISTGVDLQMGMGNIFGVIEIHQKWIVMVAQLHKLTKSYWSVHLEPVNVMVCELYHNEAV